MIRLVLDTNVLMSGVFWSGAPSKILEAWYRKEIKLVISPNIIDEYIRVGQALNQKYTSINIQPIIDLIVIYSELVWPRQLSNQISRDADDNKFIITALTAKCNLIVSGDKDLLDIKHFINIKIIKPFDFVKKYLKKI